MRKMPFISLFLFFGLHGVSQNEADALRYSHTSFGGSAKYTAMAGSFGALGGEISALGINPAGIGIFRKTEMSVSANFMSNTSSTTHTGTTTTDFKLNATIPQIGLVTTYNVRNESGWKTLNFGITYNRNTSFHSRYVAEGQNNTSSLLDVYREQVATNNLDPFGADLAWKTYLVDVDTSFGENNYFTAIPNYGETQRNAVTEKGSMSEIDFTFGANYHHRLYLGATIGIPSVNYTRRSIYTETVPEEDMSTSLQSFTLSERLNTTGSGFNIKLGAIYRIHDFVRVGAAIHSPTIMNLTDTWSTSMEAKYTSTTLSEDSPSGTFDYSILTPFKAIGSVGIIVGKLGLLNLEYEHIDYSTARLSATGTSSYSFAEENKQIEKKYTQTSNIKIGTEWRMDAFKVRAGLALYGNPFDGNYDNVNSKRIYTCGFGYKGSNFYVDFAYALTQYENTLYLYNAGVTAPSSQKFTTHNFVSTVGVRF